MLAVSQITPTALPFVPNPMGEGYAPLSPASGKPMVRAVKPKCIAYKGVDHTYLQPGWYDLETGFSVQTAADDAVSRRMAAALRSRVDGKVGA